MRKKGFFIVIVCDFEDEFALAQMKGAIYKINPKARIVIGSSQITPFSISEGAFVIKELVNYYPKDSIFVGVVDPEVGTERKGIFIKTKNNFLVGPDNGLLIPAMKEGKVEKAYWIKNDFLGKQVSNTFHGRDIFVKVAAYLSLNKDPEKLGKRISPKELVQFEFLENQVLYIDSFGNAKINSKANYPVGKKVKLKVGNRQFEVLFCKTFVDAPSEEFLLYKGSNNTLELAVNQGSAAQKLDIKVGDFVKIKTG